MTDTHNNQLVDEYLALVEAERERTFAAWGDDYENEKPAHLLVQIVTKQVGALAGATLEEQNKDFADAMVAIEQQCVVIGGLLASLYELSERHRIEYLDALGELVEDE